MANGHSQGRIRGGSELRSRDVCLSADAWRFRSAGNGRLGPRVGSGASRGFAAPGRRIIGTAPGIFRPGLNHPLVGTPLNPNFAPINAAYGPGLGIQFSASRGYWTSVPESVRPWTRTSSLLSVFRSAFFDTLPLDYDSDYDGDEYPYGYDNQYPPSSSAVPDYYTQQPQFMIPQPGTVAPAESAPSAALSTPVPPPELGQLILVRRDGKVLLAVAFTVRNGDLTYVTTEGARRSFPVSELDKEATRQMNDANGTSVSLPD